METNFSPPPVEKVHKRVALEVPQRETNIRKLVGERIIGTNPDFKREDVGNAFTDMSGREKAELLYEKVMAYHQADLAIKSEKRSNPDSAPDPIDPYLISEISTLWQDKTAQDLFVHAYTQARVDAKVYRLSELGGKWHELNGVIAKRKEAFEKETRKLFLQEVARADQVSATKGKTQRLAKELINLEDERRSIVKLEDFPAIKENTDVSADIMYEQLQEYRKQVQEGGFAWLPSREKIHLQTIAALQNARWPVLIGEAGTGKSEQADAAALTLTGEQPTHIACSERTSYRDLIADKAIDPQTGGSYDEYGPVMQAATGYSDSRQEKPGFSKGRVVRFDESGRMSQQAYALVKELRQKKPASKEDIEKWRKGEAIDPDKLLHGKPVLPGFSSEWTTNPVGPRYPDRSEPDVALRRELSYIPVDYPPMSNADPELYEFMLATLMDKNGHIAAVKDEIAPHYVKVEFSEENPRNLPDGRKVIGTEVINSNAAYREHGVLYRLSFAVRALQDAFNYGNSSDIPSNALRYSIDADGKIKIVREGGEELTLSSSTITLGEVASWMQGYNERLLKDNPDYQVKSLTEWTQLKLNTYLNQVDSDDREKIRAIFEHFHLFDQGPDISNSTPLTPQEIGYLSPRVPRPLEVEEPVEEEVQVAKTEEKGPQTEAKIYEDVQVMLEDGTTALVTPKPLTLNIRQEA